MQNKLFIGPGNILPSAFLHHLRDLGMHVELRNLHETAKASMIRVAYRLSAEVKELEADLSLSTNHFLTTYDSTHPHYNWQNNTCLLNVILQKRYCDERHGCLTQLKAGRLPDDSKRKIQKEVCEVLKDLEPAYLPGLLNTLRERLKRFKTGVHESCLAGRAHRRLTQLQGKIQPVVVAVYLRTLLNGWSTRRRMESMPNCNLAKECPFCKRAQDSLEHFVHCPIIVECFRRHGFASNTKEKFLGLGPDALPNGIVKIAKLLSGLYIARNTLLHQLANSPKEVLRFACQLVSQ